MEGERAGSVPGRGDGPSGEVRLEVRSQPLSAAARQDHPSGSSPPSNPPPHALPGNSPGTEPGGQLGLAPQVAYTARYGRFFPSPTLSPMPWPVRLALVLL